MADDGENLYFAGKLVRANGAAVVVDRLGSVVSGGRRYFPYGEERTPTANGQDKFATYYRDVNGLDYAEQRYYNGQWGRFTSPDPYKASASTTNPQSWNRYAYVEGDPINYYDPKGHDSESPNSSIPSIFYCQIFPSHPACFGDGQSIPPGVPGEDHLQIPDGGSFHSGREVWSQVHHARKNELVKNTYEDIASSLLSDSDCLDWLANGTRWTSTGVSREYVRNVIYSFSHNTATGVYSGLGDAGTFVDGPKSVGSDSFSIIINVRGGFFSSEGTAERYRFATTVSAMSAIQSNTSNTDAYRVGTLLHELAHYSGAAGFRAEAGDRGATVANNDLLWSKCKTTMQRFQGTR
jgi:RHS repeat-associated protein